MNEISQMKSLVTPGALERCTLAVLDSKLPLLDLSFLRVVAGDSEGVLETLQPEKGKSLPMVLHLDAFSIEVLGSFQSCGKGWIRFGLDSIVPSAHAKLRIFLNARKIGESIVEDWRTETLSHYHGLNETELWVDIDGGLTFLYLVPEKPTMQFIVRVKSNEERVKVGTILRQDYLDKMDMSGELPIRPLEEKENYGRLSECRDIVTNFRPTGQTEFHLKQRLLKFISDRLYASPRRVAPAPPPLTRQTTLPRWAE